MKDIPILYQNKEDCCGCKACANACPTDAISFEEDEYGFFYPKIDDNKCIRCGKCVQTCDFQKRDGGVIKNYPLHCYAAVNKNKSILKRSTSGGVFSALADIVFEDGGVVFGCVFDENLNPKHVMAENMDQLEPMHGSKYVQSDAGFTYRQVKELLEKGRTVLYSGTPCQIAGLYSFLGKSKTERLLTAELVCHGVPSAEMFHRYISFLEKKRSAKISNYKFRSKEYGWGIRNCMYDQTYTESNGKKGSIPSFVSAYMVNYRRNNLHRSGCYQCPYATSKRTADFTMGDFWGFGSVGAKSEYKRGLSIFLMNTEKAAALYPQLAQRLNLEEINDIDAAIHTNGNLFRPSPKGEQYDRIMESYVNGTFEKLLEEHEKSQKKAARTERLKRLIPVSVYLALKRVIKN